jgi:hypothetical protein
MSRKPAESEEGLPDDEGFRWFQDTLRKILNRPQDSPPVGEAATRNSE